MSDINLGGENQQRDVTVTQQITFTSTEATNQSVALEFLNVDAKHQASFSANPVVVDANSTATVTVSIKIPEDQDSGTVEIGQVKGTYGAQTVQKPINLQTGSELEIKDLDITVASESDSNVQNSDKISKEARPGDTVTLDFEIKNTFSSDKDVDIDDVELEVTIKDIDDGDDLEETIEFDLQATDTQSETVTFTVPFDVDEDDYTVEIKVKGTDDNDAEHEVNWEITLEVEKERDSVLITKADLSQLSISCDLDASITVRLKNIGSRSQANGRLTIVNEQLGINVDQQDIFLNKNINNDDNEYSKSFLFDIPENLANGEYTLRVQAYRDLDELLNRKDVTLTKTSCGTLPIEEEVVVEQVVEQVANNNEDNTSGVSETIRNVFTGASVNSVEIPFTESSRFIVLLLTANIVVLLAIFGMTVALFRR
ncbi:MAG: hypothetical protein CMH61_00960 [Nanoarchaeota archaeon]|nr:hypothetical protein [Nanoarchaeota archaeon]